MIALESNRFNGIPCLLSFSIEVFYDPSDRPDYLFSSLKTSASIQPTIKIESLFP